MYWSSNSSSVIREGWLKRTEGDVVVIFVHGLRDDILTCWTNDNGTFWPKLLVDDPLLPILGVYLFGYRADTWNRFFSVTDAAERLHSELERDGVFEKKALVFVAHSLGGLVVRKLITSRQVRLNSKKLGLFLVASPARGADYLGFFRKLTNDVGNPQIKALKPVEHNRWLEDLDHDFFGLEKRGDLWMRGIELVEDEAFIPFVRENWFQGVLKFLCPKRVVSDFEGQRNFESYKVQFSDHSSIAKPASINAEQHRKLVHFISANFDRWIEKDRVMTSNTSGMQTTHEVLLNAERELADPKKPNSRVPHRAIIDELEAEQAARTRGRSRYMSRKDGDDLRNLPAFFEDVYVLLQNAGAGALDIPSIYDSKVGGLVLLCDESEMLWIGGGRKTHWKIFNQFAAAMRGERAHRQPRAV